MKSKLNLPKEQPLPLNSIIATKNYKISLTSSLTQQTSTDVHSKKSVHLMIQRRALPNPTPKLPLKQNSSFTKTATKCKSFSNKWSKLAKHLPLKTLPTLSWTSRPSPLPTLPTSSLKKSLDQKSRTQMRQKAQNLLQLSPGHFLILPSTKKLINRIKAEN